MVDTSSTTANADELSPAATETHIRWIADQLLQIDVEEQLKQESRDQFGQRLASLETCVNQTLQFPKETPRLPECALLKYHTPAIWSKETAGAPAILRKHGAIIYNTAMKLLERADSDPQNSLVQVQGLSPLCRLVALGLELSRLGQPPQISPPYIMTVLRGARRALDVVVAAGKLHPDELMSVQRAVGLQAFLCVAEPQDTATMREYARTSDQAVELEQIFAYAVVDKYFYEEAKHVLEEMLHEGGWRRDPAEPTATTPASSSGNDRMHALERSHKLISSNIQQLMLGCDVVDAQLHPLQVQTNELKAMLSGGGPYHRSFMEVAVFTPLRRLVGRCIAFKLPNVAQLYLTTLRALQDEIGALRPLRDDLTMMELSLEVGDLDSVRRALDTYNDRMSDDNMGEERVDGRGMKDNRDGFFVCLIARAKLIILEQVQPNAVTLLLAPRACVGAVQDCWQHALHASLFANNQCAAEVVRNLGQVVGMLVKHFELSNETLNELVKLWKRAEDQGHVSLARSISYIGPEFSSHTGNIAVKSGSNDAHSECSGDHIESNEHIEPNSIAEHNGSSGSGNGYIDSDSGSIDRDIGYMSSGNKSIHSTDIGSMDDVADECKGNSEAGGGGARSATYASVRAAQLAAFAALPVHIYQDSRICTELGCLLIEASVDRVVVVLEDKENTVNMSETTASVVELAVSIRRTLGILLAALAGIGARAANSERQNFGARIYQQGLRVLDAGDVKINGPSDLVYRSRGTWLMLRAQCLMKLGEKEEAIELLESIQLDRDMPFATTHMLLLQLSLSSTFGPTSPEQQAKLHKATQETLPQITPAPDAKTLLHIYTCALQALAFDVARDANNRRWKLTQALHKNDHPSSLVFHVEKLTMLFHSMAIECRSMGIDPAGVAQQQQQQGAISRSDRSEDREFGEFTQVSLLLSKVHDTAELIVKGMNSGDLSPASLGKNVDATWNEVMFVLTWSHLFAFKSSSKCRTLFEHAGHLLALAAKLRHWQRILSEILTKSEKKNEENIENNAGKCKSSVVEGFAGFGNTGRSKHPNSTNKQLSVRLENGYLCLAVDRYVRATIVQFETDGGRQLSASTAKRARKFWVLAHELSKLDWSDHCEDDHRTGSSDGDKEPVRIVTSFNSNSTDADGSMNDASLLMQVVRDTGEEMVKFVWFAQEGLGGCNGSIWVNPNLNPNPNSNPKNVGTLGDLTLVSLLFRVGRYLTFDQSSAVLHGLALEWIVLKRLISYSMEKKKNNNNNSNNNMEDEDVDVNAEHVDEGVLSARIVLVVNTITNTMERIHATGESGTSMVHVVKMAAQSLLGVEDDNRTGIHVVKHIADACLTHARNEVMLDKAPDAPVVNEGVWTACVLVLLKALDEQVSSMGGGDEWVHKTMFAVLALQGSATTSDDSS